MKVQTIDVTGFKYYGISKEEAAVKTEVEQKIQEEENGGVVYERDNTRENLVAGVMVTPASTLASDQQLQSQLVALGFYNGPINGDFSTELSKKAVTNFQKVYGLTANGTLNNTTRNKLSEVNTMYSKIMNSTDLTNLVSSAKLNLDSIEKRNLARTWTFLRVGMGFTTNQTAGICGNLYAESRFASDNAQDSSYPGDHNSNYTFSTGDGIGYGLEQWTEKSVKTTLKSVVNDMGLSVSDLNAQLGTIRKEVVSTRVSDWKKVLAKSSYSDVSDVFLDNIERPEKKNYTARRNYSKQIYDALKKY